jgi:UDP-MurNAc hydroxylase
VIKIRFIGHASFSVSANGSTLLCDPWTIGKVFNNGWALLSPSAEIPYEKIDYIWISHQHPDHLNFPTLKSIPIEHRNRIAILYQKHSSARIARVLHGLGFNNVNELSLYRRVTLGGGMQVMCGSVGSMDSWIAIRAQGKTILNLNDCVLSPGHTKQVRKLVGKITLLLTQFSFANWIGNHVDEQAEVARKLHDIRFRVELFKPQFTVPFASFIYFCSQENSWMNDFAVTPQMVMNLGLPGVNFMYPGDEWDSETQTFRTDDAIRKYKEDAKNVRIDPTPSPVAVELVRAVAARSLNALRTRFGKTLMVLQIEPFHIYLQDIDKVIALDPAKDEPEVLDATTELQENARYVMCSQVAWYAFAYNWGWGAMEVSGMYMDRQFSAKGENKLAFYLNLLSTEFLDFRGLSQALRTLRFLWCKRKEIVYRGVENLKSMRRHHLPHMQPGSELRSSR